MTGTAPQTAVLLIAHGSRRAEANADLVQLAEQVRGHGYPIVEVSYLELAEPTIPEGGARCLKDGVQRVLMMPYFLSPGVHVAHDLEEHRQQLMAAHPGIGFELCAPLGLHPLLVDVVMARLNEKQQETTVATVS